MATAIDASKLDIATAGRIVDNFIDVNAPREVEVLWSADRKTLWVNINGLCLLRCNNVAHTSTSNSPTED